MIANKGYAAYASSKINTATPAELTLMLYDGSIKFCNLAKIDMEKGEYGDAIHHVQRARNIIVELQSTLDFKYPVAKDFDIIYTYVFQLMVKCNTKRDMEALDEVLVQLRELRDMWKQMMKQAKQPKQPMQ